jgi:hypothetical protein
VRLACPCGRNLADVRLVAGEPRGEVFEGPMLWPEHVWPVPRPGVRQREHQQGGVISFAWQCRCGRSWQARRDRLTAVWEKHSRIGRITRLTLGSDV